MRTGMLLLVLTAGLVVTACAKEEEEVPVKTELEQIYRTVRTAFAEYDLDAARPYLVVPEGMPDPTREQAQGMAAFLPDLDAGRFIDLILEGDRAAYYAETDLANSASTEVTVIRFTRHPDGWKLAAAPHTMNSLSTDEEVGVDGMRKMMAEKTELQAFPE